MECPSCHSLNGEEALSCGLCGMVLIRREDPSSRHSKNEPLIGSSYSAEAADNAPLMRRHQRQATMFVMSTMLLQGVLVALIYLRNALFPAGEGAEADAMRQLVPIVIGVYGWLVLAMAVATTGASIGAGFWGNFGLALLPPTFPLAMARIGGRSIWWTALYLTVDALVLALAIKLFDYAPGLLFLLILLEIPLIVYHLCGCGTGTIATALGLNSYAVTLWICAAPLLLAIYVALGAGIGTAMVDAYVSSDAALNPAAFRALLDPALITGDFTVVAGLAIWAVVAWTFWIKSVYESLRYPLF